jgi:predicted dehydrogenase
MPAPVQIGVVGCGAIACGQHLPALRRTAGAVVVAVADPNACARARAAGLAPGADLHADAADLLRRDDVEAVVVAAPPSVHADLAVAASRAGKHVYVEKPLATTEADAERVLEEVACSGVTATVGFNRRWHPVFERARRLLEDGRIGDVRFVQTAFCEPADLQPVPEWKRVRSMGGGVLLDLASHHFDLVRWLLHAEVEVVRARVVPGAGDQDEAVTALSTSTGVEVQSLFSFRAAHADSVELFGTRGRLRLDRHRSALVLYRARRSGYGIRPTWEGRFRAWQTRSSIGLGGDPSYRRALEAFVQRVRGQSVQLPSLEDGLRSLQAVLGAERLAELSSLDPNGRP